MDQHPRDHDNRPHGSDQPQQAGEPWGPQHMEPPQPGHDTPPTARPATHGPRGSAVVGWVLIVLGMLGMISMHFVPPPEAEPGEGDVGAVLMEIQGKYVVGAAELMGQWGGGGDDPGAMLYEQSKPTLNIGSVAQRQRFVVLAAELVGPAEARTQLEELDELISEEIAGRTQVAGGGAGDDTRDDVLSKEQQQVQAILHTVYDISGDGGWAQVRANIAELNADQRQLLKDQLGWFGKLALAPPGADDQDARREVIGSARAVAFTLIGVFSSVGLLGLLGFVLLVIFTVMAIGGRIRSGMTVGGVHHGIYAETFGIWMIVFIVLQIGGAVAAMIVPALAMPATVLAFFASLAVLVWPVLRGARWRDVRADIGWTLGRQPAIEPVIGAAGYAMAIPLLAVGLVLTLVLLAVQSMLAPEATPLTPAGGPAHPIILELAGPSIWPKLLLLALAAVAAPIVEETMFRGVLYRHLRDASGRMGRLGSIVLSATVSGFVFAIIHPQGWVAVPALMSLAYAFCLVREWRGTIIPAMIIHAISNFIVLTTVITLLSV